MPEIHNFSLFIIASILLNVIPGPDTIYIVSRSLAQGRKAGLFSSWGVCTGAFVHTVAAALGLSAILATSAYAFAIVKYVGVGYLVYLGVKTFCERSNPLELDQMKLASSTHWAIFGQGVLVDLLNPKAAIFFLAFLPQFINPASRARVTTFIFLGAVVISIALLWDLILVMGSTAIARYLRRNIPIGKQLNRLTGIIFVGLGIKLATEKL